ncbi:MAG: hypothetical protein K5886_12465 [Lachnospiraceae bacterium]|nr:hypothetical protein [Lachnospiraceae bacterium]
MEFLSVEQMRFFIDNPEASQVVISEFALDFEPDPETVKKAVSDALRFFPRLGGRAYISDDGKNVLLKENNGPVPVFSGDGPKALGTEETNDYLFRINLHKNVMTLTAFHALGDGILFREFLIHVLYFCLKYKGEDPDGEGIIRTDEDMDPSAVFENLTGRLKDIESRPGNYSVNDRERIFLDQDDGELYGQGRYYSICLNWDPEEFHKLTKSLSTTPLVFLHVIISECFRELKDVGDKIIESGFAMDLHGKFGSVSQYEYGSISSLHYYPEYDGLSFEDRLKKAEEELSGVMDLSVVKHDIEIMEEAAAELKKYFDLRNPEIMRAFTKKRGRTGSTCFISNLGKLTLPKDLGRHVLFTETFGSPTGYEGNYYLNTFKDRSCLRYTGNSTDHSMMELLAEKLEERGISCTMDVDGICVNDHLGSLRTDG